LALCAKAGLVSVGLVALDGSLLAGNASPAATRSYAAIRAEVERMLSEAAETDAREDAELGDRRGDELPAGLADRSSRRERLRRCKEELERHQRAEQEAYEENLARRATWEAEHARKLASRKPTQGSAVSPILANLFMHYALDLWMARNLPGCPFERYADDAIVHCKTRRQAEHVLSGIAPPDPDALAQRRITTSDPDTRQMRRGGGRSCRATTSRS
jgi:Reverse transcriptase (RNA-dependent DNA polymerase)